MLLKMHYVFECSAFLTVCVWDHSAKTVTVFHCSYIMHYNLLKVRLLRPLNVWTHSRLLQVDATCDRWMISITVCAQCFPPPQLI